MTYLSSKKLKYQFVPTSDKYNEIRKTKIKNHNLPILQFLYNGDELEPLKCLISNEPGWENVPDRITGQDKLRFNIDFNHIRQEQLGNKQAGISKDKGASSPSELFRTVRLDEDKNKAYLVEFMTIIPISQKHHSYVSQDSAMGHISLYNYTIDEWPWFLENDTNFKEVCKRYNLQYSYSWFVDHLNEINYPSIHSRKI